MSALFSNLPSRAAFGQFSTALLRRRLNIIFKHQQNKGTKKWAHVFNDLKTTVINEGGKTEINWIPFFLLFGSVLFSFELYMWGMKWTMIDH